MTQRRQQRAHHKSESQSREIGIKIVSHRGREQRELTEYSVLWGERQWTGGDRKIYKQTIVCVKM